MRKPILTLVAVSLWCAVALPAEPLAHTYSIVARDPLTGNFGVAVQSHWFQVGPIVPWAAAGVGAVATQSFVKVDYGPEGLELMRQGLSARAALDRLLGADPQRDVRQVAMVDRQGSVAAWTGPDCIPAAGHQSGDGYSVQANLMVDGSVWPAMAKAYEAAEGDFAERLLAALDAAEAAGGDIRGRQSAALLVVASESSAKPWADRLVDLRVDDDAEPLAELRRLLHLHRAYEEMNRGDEAIAAGRVEEALGHYSRASKLAPEVVEIPFWQAVTLFTSGREDEALGIFRQVFAREQRWIEITRRLPEAGLLPRDPDRIGKILALAETDDGARAPGSPLLRIEGRLTDEGVECPALRGTDGKLYTLTGDLGRFRAGDRVWIEGTAARISFCMQGTTIAVERIGALGQR